MKIRGCQGCQKLCTCIVLTNLLLTDFDCCAEVQPPGTIGFKWVSIHPMMTWLTHYCQGLSSYVATQIVVGFEAFLTFLAHFLGTDLFNTLVNFLTALSCMRLSLNDLWMPWLSARDYCCMDATQWCHTLCSILPSAFLDQLMNAERRWWRPSICWSWVHRWLMVGPQWSAKARACPW